MSKLAYKVKQYSKQYLVVLYETNILGVEEDKSIVFSSWSKGAATLHCDKLNRRLRNVEGSGSEPT